MAVVTVPSDTVDDRAPSDPVRVLLVDDDPLVRAGLRMILGGATGISVVGEAEDGSEAVALARQTRPDVVLMDIRMPRVDGLEATRRLGAGAEAPKVIVLTTFDADEYVVRALADGAAGFLLKDTPPGEIVEAVRRVAEGEPILSPSVTAQLIAQVTAEHGTAGHAREAAARRLVARLSDREREVAIGVGRGLPNAEIAAELYMSVATVKAHVSRVLEKLDAANRTQIAITMHDAGLI
jgi:DNA-binding NarL/FixJ family response regulator